MLEQVETIRAEIERYQANSQAALEVFKQRFIAKKGDIAKLFVNLQKAEPATKKVLGKVLNELKSDAQKKFKLLIEQVSTATQSNRTANRRSYTTTTY